MSSFAHDAQAAARHGRVLKDHEHRPWPLPDAPWFMGQTWDRLLFAHWRVPVEALRAAIPPQIPIDTFDGSAWLGITPFTVSGFHLRRTPPLPLVSSFYEINVRTYATIDGRPGIYFLSLDASSRVAVEGARRLYRLPYFDSDIDFSEADERIGFSSERTQADGPPAAIACEYGPSGELFEAQPGTLEYFLTERYCLYGLDDRERVHRGEIHHPPWPLQPATATVSRNTMASPFGIAPQGEPLLHYAHCQDVVFWPLQPVGRG